MRGTRRVMLRTAAIVAGGTAGATILATSAAASSKEGTRSYQPRFRAESERRAGPAKIPSDAEDKERLAHHEDSLSKVSSLSNAIADIHRDRTASPFMDMAVEEAAEGVVKGEGGPFGAVIVDLATATTTHGLHF